VRLLISDDQFQSSSPGIGRDFGTFAIASWLSMRHRHEKKARIAIRRHAYFDP